MKAFAIDKYKGALSLREVPEPVPGPGEVVIAIAAASVNPIDWKLRDGEFKAILPMKMPLILGCDLAGTVVATGSGASRFEVGDEVFACAGTDGIGTFAERIALPEVAVALKPSSLSMIEAAALPLVALTAWQVLVERGQVKKGYKVLIHAGSGGVGTIAIQLAKHLGATVATTVGTANVDLAKSLGADVAIDYRNDDFAKRLSGYDLVLNSFGSDELQKSLSVLKPGGKLISISGPPDLAFGRAIGANWLIRQILRLASFRIRLKARQHGVDYSFLFMHPDGHQLTEFANLVDAGAIRPVIDEEFAFAETPAALDRSASGRARGKVVIRVALDTAAS